MRPRSRPAAHRHKLNSSHNVLLRKVRGTVTLATRAGRKRHKVMSTKASWPTLLLIALTALASGAAFASSAPEYQPITLVSSWSGQETRVRASYAIPKDGATKRGAMVLLA